MIIPFDLFPRRKVQINTKWASSTYKYYSTFNPDVMMSDNPSKSEVNSWILFSKELFDCLKSIAQERIMKEIVLVAKRYQLQTLKKTKIISFEDILRLYKNKEWYYSKLQNNRDYLYFSSMVCFVPEQTCGLMMLLMNMFSTNIILFMKK